MDIVTKGPDTYGPTVRETLVTSEKFGCVCCVWDCSLRAKLKARWVYVGLAPDKLDVSRLSSPCLYITSKHFCPMVYHWKK